MKKSTLYLTVVIVIFYSCIPLKKQADTFKTNYYLQSVMKYNDSIFRDKFNFYITYQEQFIIYEFPYYKTFEENYIPIYDSLKYEYFICDSSKNYGYMFQDFYDSIGILKNRDSLLKAKGLVGHELSKLKDISKVTRESESSASDEVIHKFYTADSLIDSCYFYYNVNMQDAHFSFSRTLDSTYHSKLYKVIFFYKKGIFSPKEDTSKFDGVIMEIKKVPITNLEEMKILITKVEAIESSNKASGRN